VQIELAPPGDPKRELVTQTSRRARHRRDDRDEDKDFDQPRFDPIGTCRPASTPCRARPGGHRRSPSSCPGPLLPAEAFSGSVASARRAEIIQSIRLTKLYSGAKKRHHHRVPQPEL
jgi:hypothetical protein